MRDNPGDVNFLMNHRLGHAQNHAQGHFETGLRLYGSHDMKSWAREKERNYWSTSYKDKKDAQPTFLPNVEKEKTIRQEIRDKTLEKRNNKKEFKGKIPQLQYSAFDGRHKYRDYQHVEKCKRRNVGEAQQVFRASNTNMNLANWAMSLR